MYVLVQKDRHIANSSSAVVIYTFHQTEKQPLFFESFNLAFTFATLDLKMNWRRYKEDLEKELMK